jgi:hypothetical protein
MFRLMVAAIVAVAFIHFSGTAIAQDAAKQIKLTDKQVEGFIAAQKDMAAVSNDAGKGDAGKGKADPQAEAKIQAIVKKYGFASLDEYDDVEANIMMVLTGIDPQSKSFTQPPAMIKKQIDELKADKSMAAKDKQKAQEELNQALKTAQPIQFPTNIELIKKNYDKIEAALK